MIDTPHCLLVLSNRRLLLRHLLEGCPLLRTDINLEGRGAEVTSWASRECALSAARPKDQSSQERIGPRHLFHYHTQYCNYNFSLNIVLLLPCPISLTVQRFIPDL